MCARESLRAPLLAALFASSCTVITQPDEDALFATLTTAAGTGAGPASSSATSTGAGGNVTSSASSTASVSSSSSGGGGASSSSSGGGGAGGTSSSSGGGGAGGTTSSSGGGGAGGAGGLDPCAGFPEETPPAPVVSFLAGVTVTTLAGAADPGLVDGDGGLARFQNPVSLAFDGPLEDQLFVTDFENDAVRVLSSGGTVTTLFAAEPTFSRPFAVALGADGWLYVQTDVNTTGQNDAASGTIWQLDPAGMLAPVVLAENAGRPRGLVAFGAELAVSDVEHDIVELFDPLTSAFTLLAGQPDCENFVDGIGGDARFEFPYGPAIDPNGDIVVVDRGNHAIRRITAAGVVTTLAGNGSPGMVDGTLAEARFFSPIDLAIDALGRIYVSDLGNQRIRRIDELADEVVTIAGDGVRGFADGDGDAARFFGQEGIEVTADGGTVFLADGTEGLVGEPYHRVRRIDLP